MTALSSEDSETLLVSNITRFYLKKTVRTMENPLITKDKRAKPTNNRFTKVDGLYAVLTNFP